MKGGVTWEVARKARQWWVVVPLCQLKSPDTQETKAGGLLV